MRCRLGDLWGREDQSWRAAAPFHSPIDDMRWITREAMARDVEIGMDLMREWLAEFGVPCKGGCPRRERRPSWLGWPGWTPKRRFLPRPCARGGGLTISLEGRLWELEEFFARRAMRALSWAMRLP